MTELIQHQSNTDLSAQMDYARAVSTGSMLPAAYRGKPADILLAVGLGQAMGLSPAESLYRIDVIQGKPTASAELIAANVRKAGHRLRVRGDDQSCTASIYRSDDPDFEFTVTRDADWAKAMGLHTKDNYKKQPGTMLQWRAITAVARLACPEALYGVAYVREELDDMPRQESAPKASAGDFMPATVVTPEAVEEERADTQPVEDEPDTQPKLTAAQQRKLFALFKAKGIAEADQLSGIAFALQRPIESRTAMTADEFETVVALLEQQPDVAEAGGQA